MIASSPTNCSMHCVNDMTVPCTVTLCSAATGVALDTCMLQPGASHSMPCPADCMYTLKVTCADGSTMHKNVSMGNASHVCLMSACHPGMGGGMRMGVGMMGGMGGVGSGMRMGVGMMGSGGMGPMMGSGGMGHMMGSHMGMMKGMAGMGAGMMLGGGMVSLEVRNDLDAVCCMMFLDASCSMLKGEMCMAPGSTDRVMLPAGTYCILFEKENGCRLKMPLDLMQPMGMSCSGLMAKGMAMPMQPLKPGMMSFLACNDSGVACDVSLHSCGSGMTMGKVSGAVSGCSLAPGETKELGMLAPGCYTVCCAFMDGVTVKDDVDMTAECCQWDLSVAHKAGMFGSAAGKGLMGSFMSHLGGGKKMMAGGWGMRQAFARL